MNSYLSKAFDVNSHDVPEKTRFTDDGTTDGLLYRATSSAILDECKNRGMSTFRIIFWTYIVPKSSLEFETFVWYYIHMHIQSVTVWFV